MSEQIILENEKFKYKYLNTELLGNLEEFYKTQYSNVLHERVIKRTKDNSELDQTNIIDDRVWIESQVYEDINIVFEKSVKGLNRTLLDIGCGIGNLLQYMKKKGWSCSGIEPSFENYPSSLYKGIQMFGGTLQEYLNQNNAAQFSCITLNNVFEHIPNPVEVLKEISNLLEPEGIIMIKVPNDFNVLQAIANDYVENENWWISIPDHVNYFNLDSICRLLEGTGFEVLEKTCDFPMELFLLMGENYVDNEIVGQGCHNKRKHLEMSLPRELKTELYKKFAELGLGRNIIVYGRKK